MSHAVLYNATETNFKTMGLGPLRDAESRLITEGRNGVFELNMKYPITGVLFNELQNNRIIKANAGHELKDQRFRIAKISKIFEENGEKYINVYAEHVSYLTQELAMKPEVYINGYNADVAIKTWKNAILDKNPFEVSSDILTTGTTSWHIRDVENPRMALGGVKGSLLDIYGGEYKFDNYKISLLKQRGKRANTIIKYGRNLISLEQEEYITSTYTTIFPYAIYDDDGVEKLITVDGYLVDSEHVDKYPNRKVLNVDFSSEFDTENNRPTTAKLKNLAEKYIKANDIGIPKVSIKLDYIDLSQTLDYKDLAVFEEVNLCDELPVYFAEMGIKTTAKVVRVVWNDIMDRYESIELGEPKTTLGTIINNIDKNVTEIKTAVNETQLAANGKNTIFRGPDTPTAKEIGDMWYKPVGDEVIFHIWNGQAWEEIFSTAGLTEVKKIAEEAATEAEAAKESANQAVVDANQAISDAGFAKDSADKAKEKASQAAINAVQAIADAQKAIDSVDTLDQSVKTEITTINGQISQKANQVTVDKIQGTVTTHGTQINQNKNDIALKASQTEVNTLTGKVTAAESKLSVQAGQIAGLVTKTDGQTTDITQLKLTADGLSSTVSKVQNDLDNLEIGNTNRVFGSAFDSLDHFFGYNGDIVLKGYKGLRNSFKGIQSSPAIFQEFLKQYLFSEARNIKNRLEDNQWYSLSFKARGTEGAVLHSFVFPNRISVKDGMIINGIKRYGEANGQATHELTDEWKKYFVVFKTNVLAEPTTTLLFRERTKDAEYEIAEIKLEKGNKVTDWSPASEDMATQTEYSNIQQTVEGIQTTVARKADQSQVTQLAGQIASTVSSINGHTSQINQLSNTINLKVSKGDLISQINIEAGRTLIESNTIVLSSNTVIFTGSAFIPSAAIVSLKAEQITTGILNAASVNIINMNASNIVTGTLSAIAIKGVTITGSDILSITSNYGTRLYQGRLSFTNSSKGEFGWLGPVSTSGGLGLLIMNENDTLTTHAGQWADPQYKYASMNLTPFKSVSSLSGIDFRLFTSSRFRIEFHDLLGSLTKYVEFGRDRSYISLEKTTLYVTGSFSVSGSKNAIHVTRDGVRATPAYETAESYLGDIGESSTGKTCKIKIPIEDLFNDTVNTTIAYQVFLSKYCNANVWVSSRAETYFVVESDKPDAQFTWEIKAKRRGYEDDRLVLQQDIDNKKIEEIYGDAA